MVLRKFFELFFSKQSLKNILQKVSILQHDFFKTHSKLKFLFRIFKITYVCLKIKKFYVFSELLIF